MTVLPTGVDSTKLIRDPAGRSGHWLDVSTDTVYNMGPDFQPNGEGVKTANDPPAVDPLLGKRVEVTQDGPLIGKRGQISDTEAGDDHTQIEVIMDGDGAAVRFDGIDNGIRLLTAEEVAAGEAALKASKKGK